MPDARRSVGAAGEDAAARHLEGTGMTVLERGYRSGRGEVDIVAADGEELVFVEVKASVGGRFGSPAARVDARKRRQLIRLAQRYMLERGREDAPVRFDVVGVVFGARGSVRTLEHITNAFIRE